MSRTGWFITNLLLAVVAALTTRAILRPPTVSEAASAGRRRAAVDPTQRAAPVPVKDAGSGSHSALVTAVLGEADTLWKDSLFRPDRTEDIVTEATAPSATPNAAVQFELIGVGLIADKSAAIILVKSNRPRTTSPTSRGRGSRPLPSAPPERKRHVYRLGDEIADTGYVLKEIKLTEVTVARGDQTQVLKLERGDASSKKRKEDAAREEAARKRKAAATAKSSGNRTGTAAAPGLPPPPPPPPPAAVPGGPGGPPTPGRKTTTPAPTTYQERMRRALEARRRILERRKATATQ